MYAIIIGIIIWIICIYLVYTHYRGIEFIVYGLMVGIAIGLVLFIFFPLIGGLYSGYGKVEQVGYISNLNERGVLWKTYECELQKGIGEQTSVDKHFYFSATDKDVILKLKKYFNLEKCVKVSGNQWLCMPAWRGSTNIEATNVIETSED